MSSFYYFLLRVVFASLDFSEATPHFFYVNSVVESVMNIINCSSSIEPLAVVAIIPRPKRTCISYDRRRLPRRVLPRCAKQGHCHTECSTPTLAAAVLHGLGCIRARTILRLEAGSQHNS